MSDLFSRDAVERAKQRRRVARGGERQRRQRELQQAVAAELLTEISEEERQRLVGKYRPLRQVAS